MPTRAARSVWGMSRRWTRCLRGRAWAAPRPPRVGRARRGRKPPSPRCDQAGVTPQCPARPVGYSRRARLRVWIIHLGPSSLGCSQHPRFSLSSQGFRPLLPPVHHKSSRYSKPAQPSRAGLRAPSAMTRTVGVCSLPVPSGFGTVPPGAALSGLSLARGRQGRAGTRASFEFPPDTSRVWSTQ